MQRFTRKLKHPNQRQDAFFGPLKCSNHPKTKVQSCRSQKVGIIEWRRFFLFDGICLCSVPSGGFYMQVGTSTAKRTSRAKLVFQSGVRFLIRCNFDHGLCHLVDLFKKFPIPQDFIWLGWINYNSSIQNHVVSSRSLIFKPKVEFG